MNKILFAKLKEDAKIPTKEKENAGYDIYPCFEEDYLVIPPNETKLIPTGIAGSVPEGFYFQIQERGSSGSKGIKYSAGVIDSSYRGEWFLAATNCNTRPIVVLKTPLEDLPKLIRNLIEDTMIIYPYEKALFQAIVHNVHNELEPLEISYTDLTNLPSSRGTGCLGSTNK